MVARMVAMEQANVSSVTGMDTLRENAVRKRIGVTSATSLATLPKTARTRARRPATAAQVKATLPWTVPAAREKWTWKIYKGKKRGKKRKKRGKKGKKGKTR